MLSEETINSLGLDDVPTFNNNNKPTASLRKKSTQTTRTNAQGVVYQSDANTTTYVTEPTPQLYDSTVPVLTGLTFVAAEPVVVDERDLRRRRRNRRRAIATGTSAAYIALIVVLAIFGPFLLFPLLPLLPFILIWAYPGLCGDRDNNNNH
jgi:hypothetical protein